MSLNFVPRHLDNNILENCVLKVMPRKQRYCQHSRKGLDMKLIQFMLCIEISSCDKIDTFIISLIQRASCDVKSIGGCCGDNVAVPW